MPTRARIEAMLLVSSAPMREGVVTTLAPGPSTLTSIGHASGAAHPESYWAADGPFWPAAFMHSRSVQPLGHEAVVASFPACVRFDVMCVIGALEDCQLAVEVRDGNELVFVSPSSPVRVRTVGWARPTRRNATPPSRRPSHSMRQWLAFTW